MPPFDDWNTLDKYVSNSEEEESQTGSLDWHYNYQEEHEEDDYYMPFRPTISPLSPHPEIKAQMDTIEVSDYKDGIATMAERAFKGEFERVTQLSANLKYNKANPPLFKKQHPNKLASYAQLRAGMQATQVELTIRLYRAILKQKRKCLIKYTKSPRLFEYVMLNHKAGNGSKIRIALSPIRAGVRKAHLAQEIRIFEMMILRRKAYLLGLLSISLGGGEANDPTIRRVNGLRLNIF
ncbi:hypothetical protein JR316_0002832 [Psilocybe cubensis]|uniref:Uncharacterized protein n=2 Tax=Psilocybe cubensis TaxID=181762 RepID=A0ACB8HFJ0_PSICU|nr:hypothetical protein JR316_0002832 [Psilocybe cubensis]KAH9485915.1 hypothetical protein JR316_0002832 [Psilocybe cubensis]